MLTMRYPTTEDVMTLALNMRKIDQLEMRCVSVPGTAAVERLGVGVMDSDGVLAVYDTDLKTCICIFGYMKEKDTPRDIGVIWCIGTKWLKQHPIQFVRWGKMFIEAIAAEFDEGVYNVIHQKNYLSKRWLQACGCYVHPGAPLTYSEEPFTWFQYTSEAV